MGFNSMMLYTEDTYEIKTQPHFGYMRGRFTAEEIKELDDYAYLHGIELIPCIQTLAHLRTLFQWPEYIPLCDTGDILLAENEEVHKLIDDMLDTCTANFRTKKILLGMDEAPLLGKGQYIKLNGYKPNGEIMKKHLRIVVDKCRKRGLEPEIWSDMFFRMNSKSNRYYDKELTKIPQETIDSVPDDLTLLYWDYYSTDSERYDFMFDRHREFKNTTGFAGGASNWYGIVPLNSFSANAARTALTSAIKHKTNEVW